MSVIQSSILDKSPKSIYLPISYFGPISYYATLIKYDCHIEHHENYQKRSIRNRALILSANGPISLSVPLKKGKTTSPISEVEIAYNDNWANNHIRSIVSAYGTAPYFDFYIDKVKSLINSNSKTLMEFNSSIHNYIIKLLDLDSTMVTDHYDSSEEIMRPIFLENKKSVAAYTSTYLQVFSDRYDFVQDLSILDLIFNVGPESKDILKSTQLSFS